MPPSGPSSADQRMFCLQLTLTAFSGNIIKAEEVVEYAGKLENYIRNGHKVPSGLEIVP